MKLIRFLLLLLILFTALFIWRWIYKTVFLLLDFQIWMYSFYLSSGEQIWAITDNIAWLVDKVFWWTPDTNTNIEITQAMETRVAQFTKKLHILSAGVGAIVGYVVWKILFDIVFWFTTMLSNVKKFLW